LYTARAIENQCYVLAAAQYGQHNEKRLSYGHSLSIDPWGKIISDAGGYDGLGSNPHQIPTTPSITLCDIDDALILEVRDKMPLHRVNYSL
jgi:predicted amidohydrolase